MAGVRYREEQLVQSFDRGLHILEIIANFGKPMSVTQLSQELDVHKSTIFRLLNTLSSRGFVEQDPETQKYKLGLKILELSNRLLFNLEVSNVALPYLRDIVERLAVVGHLGVLNDSEVVYIQKIEGSEASVMYSQIGRRAPVHCTSMGKSMLAYLPEEDARRILEAKGLQRMTPKTICSIDELIENLRIVRFRGYALDNEENEMGIRCIGAPILDYHGSVIAAISISSSISRLDELKFVELTKEVSKAGLLISRQMGYVGKNGDDNC